MMENVGELRVRRCMYCGKEMTYGRTDRKFCCERCKNAYHNQKNRRQKNYRDKVLLRLEKNHEILCTLMHLGMASIEVQDLLEMGYMPEYVTGYRKLGRKTICSCFEIRYVQTQSKICGLRRGLLSEEGLPYGKEK